MEDLKTYQEQKLAFINKVIEHCGCQQSVTDATIDNVTIKTKYFWTINEYKNETEIVFCKSKQTLESGGYKWADIVLDKYQGPELTFVKVAVYKYNKPPSHKYFILNTANCTVGPQDSDSE